MTSVPCLADGCERRVQAKGLCFMHYKRKRNTGRVDKECLYPGCGVPHLNRSRKCSDHEFKCDVPTCTHVPRTSGAAYCKMHATRAREGTDLPFDAPSRRGSLDGNGCFTSPKGYKLKTVNGTGVFYHRIVMEQHLGRPLARNEEVHHINGDRADNRVENLELWSTKQPKGQRVADKIKWAQEILAQYKDEFDMVSKL